MSYLIGVDGGGSKTRALIAGPDQKLLGHGNAGSSNYHAVGIEAACAALDQALLAAFASAQLEPRPKQVSMACFGLAGVDRPADQEPLQAWARSRWPGMPVVFVNDARLALAAGTPEGWGIAVICGTGSILYGRSPQGQAARAGGWGYLLGDEGSGYDIGLTALRAVMRAADGRDRQTLLSEMVLEHWSLGSVSDLVQKVYDPATVKTSIASLAGLVEQAAVQGDAVAQEILKRAGYELALGAGVVARKLALSQATPCALAGGLLVRGERVAAEFLAAAAALGLELDPVQKVDEPAQGAVRLAAEFAKIR